MMIESLKPRKMSKEEIYRNQLSLHFLNFWDTLSLTLR